MRSPGCINNVVQQQQPGPFLVLLRIEDDVAILAVVAVSRIFRRNIHRTTKLFGAARDVERMQPLMVTAGAGPPESRSPWPAWPRGTFPRPVCLPYRTVGAPIRSDIQSARETISRNSSPVRTMGFPFMLLACAAFSTRRGRSLAAMP